MSEVLSWKTPSTFNESTVLGRRMSCCIGNPKDHVSVYIKQGRIVPYFLVNEAEMPVAAALLLPQWNAISTIAAYGATPLEYGQYCDYYIELLNQFSIGRVLDTSVTYAGYVKVNGLWTHTSKFVPNMVVKHTLDLTNHFQLTSLPPRLTIEGDLILSRTSITELPRSLTVTGSLDVRLTSIWSKPPCLQAGAILTSGQRVLS